VNAGLAVAAVVLWGFADWTWWVLLPLFVTSVLSRVVFSLFFSAWQEWAGSVVLVATILFLTTWSSGWVLWIALGVALLGVAWGLRLVSPKWLRLVALGLGVVLALTGTTVVFVTWANGRAERERQDQLSRDFAVAKMRPDSGVGMFRGLVRSVSEDDPKWGCRYFTPEAAQQFADVVGAQDCPTAFHKLHGQITDKRSYLNAQIPVEDSHYPQKGEPAWAAGCNLQTLENGPPGGPMLGVIRLDTDPRFRGAGGYLITSYTPCGTLPPGVVLKAPERPLLPSYAPSYAAMVASRAARRDEGVCLYMTDRGQQQFAAAWGGDTCAEALGALAGKVTDPDRYREPQDAKDGTQDADGRVTIDACRLTWDRWGDKPGTPAPGPQLGYITVTHPDPGEVGWMIDGWRPCSS
jgi:hypothetical protein